MDAADFYCIFSVTVTYCSPLEDVEGTSFSNTAPVMAGAFLDDTFLIACAIGYGFEGDGVCTCGTGGEWIGSCSCIGEW